MNVLNKLTGYDRRTEVLDFEFDISDGQFEEVEKIVKLPKEYETTFGSFPLDDQIARQLFLHLGLHANAETHLWYIEPFAYEEA